MEHNIVVIGDVGLNPTMQILSIFNRGLDELVKSSPFQGEEFGFESRIHDWSDHLGTGRKIKVHTTLIII